MDKGGRGAAFRLLGLGWYVGICLVGGTLLGVWLDGVVTSIRFPLFTLLGLVIGANFALLGVYVMISAVLDETKRRGK